MATGTTDHVEISNSTEEGLRASLRRALRAGTYGLLNDQILVLRVRAGDPTAFDVLLAHHRGRIHTMAFNYLGEEGEVDGALCEMRNSALSDIGSPDAKRTPEAWLYMHGLRAVFQRMTATPGRHEYGSDPATDAGSRD
jgi:hypothetical protein